MPRPPLRAEPHFGGPEPEPDGRGTYRPPEPTSLVEQPTPGGGRRLLIGAAVLAIAFFAGPMAVEGRTGVCRPLESRVMSIAMSQDRSGAAGSVFARALVEQFSDGSMAQAAVRTRYPNVPPYLSCPALYWTSIVNPSLITDQMPSSQMRGFR